MIHSRLKSPLRALLRWWLQRAQTPPSFSEITQNPSQYCVVTQGRSVVLAALLDVFAQRSGIAAQVNYADCTAHGLLWVDVADTSTLTKLLQERPQIELVTLNTFARRGPIRTNPNYSLSIFQRLEIMLMVRRLVILFGTPQSFSQEIEIPRTFSTVQATTSKAIRRVQRKLKLDFFKNLKLVRGIPFQPIAKQERAVLSGHDFEREVTLIASRLKVSEQRILQRARGEFRTIAANPVRPLYAIGSRVCGIITSRLFRQISTKGLAQFESTAKNHTVVIVPMHRSHFDYLLVGQKLYESNIIPPLVAAGVNLSFWPIGYIIRSLGAYFVKRNARQDLLHALVLKRYVTYLVKRGHLQEFFIEGGRSRSGRMRAPKVGLLSTIVEAYLKGLKRDIMFVPVSITYENVVEDKSYGDENTGKSKKKENFLELLKARSIFRNRYGDVVINFGAPISLLTEAQRKYGSAAIKAQESRGLIKHMAKLLTTEIRAQTSITLTALTYTTLLASPHYGLPREKLVTAVRNIGLLATVARRINPQLGDLTPTLSAFLDGADTVLEDLVRGGAISKGTALNRDIFFIPGNRRFTADFYKNTLIHLFFPIGTFAVLQCLAPSFSPKDALALHRIFEEDLLLEPTDEFLSLCERWCAELCSLGVLRREGETHFSFARKDAGLYMPYLLLASAESIMWSFNTLKALVAEHPERRTVHYKNLLDRAQGDFRTAQYLGETSRTEASAQSSLTSAIEILAHIGIVQILENAGIPHEITLLKDYSDELELISRYVAAVSAV